MSERFVKRIPWHNIYDDDDDRARLETLLRREIMDNASYTLATMLQQKHGEWVAYRLREETVELPDVMEVRTYIDTKPIYKEPVQMVTSYKYKDLPVHSLSMFTIPEMLKEVWLRLVKPWTIGHVQADINEFCGRRRWQHG